MWGDSQERLELSRGRGHPQPHQWTDLVLGRTLLALTGEEIGVSQPVIPVFCWIQQVNIAGEHLGCESQRSARGNAIPTTVVVLQASDMETGQARPPLMTTLPTSAPDRFSREAAELCPPPHAAQNDYVLSPCSGN